MDIKQLDLFLTMAKQLSFAKTAKACFITTAAVTRSIQRLEKEMGVQLLVRDNRNVQLTDAGRRFQRFAEQTLMQYRQLQYDLDAQSKAIGGELSVFSSVTASYSVMSFLLPEFRAKYPAVELSLLTGDQAQALDLVLQGEVNIAIAAKPERLPKGIAFKTLSFSPLHFIMPTQAGLISEQVAAMQNDMPEINPAKLPMIFPDSGLTRSRLNRWLAASKQQANIYATVSGHEAIVSMVALGLGVGLVPELVIQHSPMRDQIQIIESAPTLEPFQIGICALEQQLKLPTLQAFWDNAQPQLLQ